MFLEISLLYLFYEQHFHCLDSDLNLIFTYTFKNTVSKMDNTQQTCQSILNLNISQENVN